MNEDMKGEKGDAQHEKMNRRWTGNKQMRKRLNEYRGGEEERIMEKRLKNKLRMLNRVT